MELSNRFKHEPAHALREKDLRWNRFIEELGSREPVTLSEVQKNAVLCFRYDAQMQNGGHDLFLEDWEDADTGDMAKALLAVGYREMADNFEKAVREGEKDGWRETDAVFYGFSPSLSDCLREYVEQHRDAIFEEVCGERPAMRKALEKRRRFGQLRKILGIGMALPLLPLLWFFTKAILADHGTGILLWAGILFLYAVFTVVAAVLIVRYDARLAHGLVVHPGGHTGLFGAIWEELDGFPPKELAGGKVKHLETYQHTIDLWVERNCHEILIEIDREAVSVLVDEESDSPVEWEKPLSEFADAEEFWSALKEFILQNS